MDSILNLLLGPLSSLVLVLVILYGGRAKWWVFGWYAVEVSKDRDLWKEQALRGTKLAEVVSSVLVNTNGENK